MGYNPNWNNGRSNAGQYSQNRRPNPSRSQPETISAVVLPENYVEAAEKIISEKEWNRKITTSKIRRIFSLLTEIYNTENRNVDETLKSESIGQLRLAQIRMLYEAGRDKSVKEFLEDTKLIHHLKAIGDDRAAFINYFHYMEALVAYHKYFGGREG